jgi:hypothetical protein
MYVNVTLRRVRVINAAVKKQQVLNMIRECIRALVIRIQITSFL